MGRRGYYARVRPRRHVIVNSSSDRVAGEFHPLVVIIIIIVAITHRVKEDITLA